MAAVAAAPALLDLACEPSPSDGITSINFAPTGSLLAISSWDTTVRVYDAQQRGQRLSNRCTSAALDCCWGRDQSLYAAVLDGSIMRFDATGRESKLIGRHDAAVRCVEFDPNEGLLCSGGWDGKMQTWDERARHTNVSSMDVQGKVFSMTISQHLLMVATSGRNIYVWDMRNMAHPLQRRESSLKHQTRCIRAFPNAEGFAISSIEGRVAIEYIDPRPEVQERKFAFKCHRKLLNGVDTVYPVNALAFHPTFGTFATGGCDGMVSLWDGQNQKRLALLPKYPNSIAALSFSADGSMLAVASSYTFEEGPRQPEADRIFIHTVEEKEVKPKARVAK